MTLRNTGRCVASAWKRRIELLGIGAMLAYFSTVSSLPTVPLCPLHYYTGYDCPTCGVTRSVWHLMHGRLGEAWSFNPIGFLVVALLVRRLVVLSSDRNTIIEHRIVNVAMLSWFFIFGFTHQLESFLSADVWPTVERALSWWWHHSKILV